MARRGRPARRPAAEWAVRVVLALAALALGWASITRTLAYAIRSSDPERAHRLAPEDGRITALLAQRLSGPDASPADKTRAIGLARDALRHDAAAVMAASTLGLDFQGQGRPAPARRLFAYAERLSRRDLQTDLWAIQDAVGRGDVAGALHWYDITLRTQASAPDLLYPVLSAAIGDLPVRAALVRTLAGRPEWGPGFVGYAPGHADPRAAASLFLELARVGVPVAAEARAAAINALVAGNFVDQAWSYYTATSPGADRRRARDPRFAAAIEAPTPFDWVPVNDAGISSSIGRGDRGGVFDFTAPASVGGMLLSQVELLPAGRYLLSGHSTGIDQAPDARPYWKLACRGDGRELGRVALPSSGEANGRFAGALAVPAGCPVQVLSLVAQPSEAVGGLSGQIDEARLVPQG